MNGSSRIQDRPGPLPPGSHVPAAAGADRSRRRFPLDPSRLAGPVLCIGLAACVETGDFGRAKPGIWNDVILPRAGFLAARERGEPASSYPFTDFEQELRDRSWRFLMPAHERAVFDREVADLVRARVLPARDFRTDPTAYYAALTDEPFTSPASRFRRIGEDAEADLRLVGPFGATAQRVIEADRARLRSLAFVRELSEDEVAEATARVAENRCLIAWVRAELGVRTASYRYALEHAFVAMPQNQAAEAERAVRALDLQRRSLDGLPVPLWRDGACLPPAVERRVKPPARPVVSKG
jgi:hypothetical protein